MHQCDQQRDIDGEHEHERECVDEFGEMPRNECVLQYGGQRDGTVQLRVAQGWISHGQPDEQLDYDRVGERD